MADHRNNPTFQAVAAALMPFARGDVSPAQIAHAVMDAIAAQPAPIPMILYCPLCGKQHIDAPDDRTTGWTNPPHRSHLCHGCGCVWRPADVATVGVAKIETRGKADTFDPEKPIILPREAAQPATVPETWREFLHDFIESINPRGAIIHVDHAQILALVGRASVMLAAAPQPETKPDQCAAISTGHAMGNDGPNGSRQCKYCGEPEAQAGADDAWQKIHVLTSAGMLRGLEQSEWKELIGHLITIRSAQAKPADGGAVVAWQAVYPDGKLYGCPVPADPKPGRYFFTSNADEGHPVRPLVFGDAATAGSGEAVGEVFACDHAVLHRKLPLGTKLYAGAPPAADVEAMASAWGEGYQMGVNDERESEANIGIAGLGAKVEPARVNPYRRLAGGEGV